MGYRGAVMKAHPKTKHSKKYINEKKMLLSRAISGKKLDKLKVAVREAARGVGVINRAVCGIFHMRAMLEGVTVVVGTKKLRAVIGAVKTVLGIDMSLP